MKFGTIKQLVTTLQEGIAERDKYIESLPFDISTAFIENAYSESLDTNLFQTLQLLLSAELYGDIMWFLYNWKSGFSIITPNEVTYVISNTEEYLQYLEKEFSWDN